MCSYYHVYSAAREPPRNSEGRAAFAAARPDPRATEIGQVARFARSRRYGQEATRVVTVRRQGPKAGGLQCAAVRPEVDRSDSAPRRRTGPFRRDGQTRSSCRRDVRDVDKAVAIQNRRGVAHVSVLLRSVQRETSICHSRDRLL
ncbi:Hypothetical protein CINCED_3A006703 [Cinara cedri]|uniref:Uncharacterized protein n=1 Tax=Cinara cedri TaxID=506608 RepID=A0A5E4MDR2_9HEMI|nr:Hypothetical protein CINCED_3A006703 [Cinara cedri]